MTATSLQCRKLEDFSASLEKWIPRTIVKVTGPVSYQVRLENGTVTRCHLDHIRSRVAAAPEQSPAPTPVESSDDDCFLSPDVGSTTPIPAPVAAEQQATPPSPAATQPRR